MSNKKQAKEQNSREKKKEQFSKTPKRKGNNLKLYIVIAALLAVVAYLAMGALSQDSTSTVTATAIQPTPGASEIRIPLNDVSDGQAKFYEMALNGNRTTRFFVVKTSDGVYRAALDACEVCFTGRKGYHQEGDEMVCNKCGRHFRANTVNNGTTGCHPFSLTRTVDGQSLVLKTSELQSGSRYF